MNCLCCFSTGPNSSTALLTTNEGDILSLNTASLAVTAATLSGGAQAGHGKNAINALYVNNRGSGSSAEVLVLTGGKEGKVVVWRTPTASSGVVVLEMLHEFYLLGHCADSSVPTIVVSGDSNAAAAATVASAANSKASGAGGAKKGSAAAAASGNGPTSTVGSNLPAIRSLCLSAANSKILVGTSSCEVLEFLLPNNAKHSQNSLVEYAAAAAVSAQQLVARPLVQGKFEV